jgi:UDP-N-acetylmuramate--alanine ligase
MHGLTPFSEVYEMLGAPRRIHMVGIGGIGMAGLAVLLKARGHEVSGCDLQQNRQTEWLQQKGVRVLTGHDPAHLPDAEWIIRTTAVPDDHPETANALVPVSRRGEVLAELLRDRFAIAVSGTHGKTTTTSIIAQLLGCGYCIGGEVAGFDGVARDGEIMAVEADESDGTVARYHPDIAVITNVEYDHMEHHESAEAFEACFKKFIANTKQKIIYCAGDPVAARLCVNKANAVPYGFQVSGFKFQVSLPGRHNQLNAMAAVAVAREMGLDDKTIEKGLQQIRPVRRRFEKVFAGEYTVISDYAHHPTEIRALIETALQTLRPKRLLAVFQPHRYTRTRALLADFPPAFRGLEKLWLLPVYAASEKPLAGGTSEDLYKMFSVSEKPEVKKPQTPEKAWRELQSELRAGDCLLIIGAGDVEKMVEMICMECADLPAL